MVVDGKPKYKSTTNMTYMFQVTVKNKYVGGGVQLPVGLSVRVPYESLS